MSDWAELADALRERGFAIVHTVRITQCGPNKIAVIKAVRELTGWGLKAAKDAVESSALAILESVSLATAEHAAAKLREAGARMEIDVGELQPYAFDPNHPSRGEQPIERLRVASSGLAFEQGKLGAWTAEPVQPIELARLLAAVDERRLRWAAQGKHQATSELAILVAVSAREPSLEDRLRTSDGQARAREAAVYGDWLQDRGDPRGLIAAAAFSASEAGDATAPREQRQLELDRLSVEHRSHLFGPAHSLMDAAQWTWLGPVLDTLVLQARNFQEGYQPLATCQQLSDLLGAPACACLRSLALEHSVDRDVGLGDVLADAACAPGLRELQIHGVTGLQLRGDAFARLERLAIRGRMQLGPATLPALRRLELHIEVLLAPLVAVFVDLHTPVLEHFSIQVTSYEYWQQNFGPLQTNLFELLSRPGFARLRMLAIGGGPLQAGFADLLARIPAIATLERIDLREANMTEACRAELARSRDRLPELLL